MLVDLERVVHVSLHRGADSGQPDAVGQPAKARQDAAQGADAVAAVLGVLNADPAPRRRNDWIERDRAVILTALSATEPIPCRHGANALTAPASRGAAVVPPLVAYSVMA